MAKSSFEAYVRSGKLQKAFDAGVEKAAQEAKALGLRAPAKAAAAPLRQVRTAAHASSTVTRKQELATGRG